MIPAVRRPKGHPLYALAGVIALYVGVRIVSWQSPFPSADPLIDGASGEIIPDLHQSADASSEIEVLRSSAHILSQPNSRDQAILGTDFAKPAFAFTSLSSPSSLPAYVETFDTPLTQAPISGAGEGAAPYSSTENATANQLIRSDPGEPSSSKWSMDGWLFYRPDRGLDRRGVNGVRPPLYGASQAGLILRYQIAPGQGREPAAYVRATAALDDNRQQDIAGGVSAKPLPNIPAIVAAEIRVSRQEGNTEIRPAIFAYTAIDPQPLPHDFRAELYGQAGYVGGDFATPFVDGGLRVDREVRSFDMGQIRVGAGVWGGAQKDTGRLDVGPAVTFTVDIDGTPVRLAADYRHRVAGNAQSQSGVAITVSTGF